MANRLRRLFELYTSDLSYSEIERLIKKESAEVYEFFAANIPKPDPKDSKFSRGVRFIKGLFNAFVLRLTPARRIFYFVALIMFFIGLNSNNTPYLLLSFIIVNLLIAFELADKLSLKSELDIASKVQNSLVPSEPPINENYDISIFYEPAKVVSGDYFDFIKQKDDSLYYLVGDISGKGMSAALFMVQVRAIIHSLVNLYYNPKELLINLKNILFSDLPHGVFLTIIAAVIDKSGKINLSRAGHNPIFHYSKKEDCVKEIAPKGLAIGFNDKNGLFSSMLEYIELTPEKDDFVIFYTDGVTEAMNNQNEQFGDFRLKEIILKYKESSAEELKERIISGIYRFRGEAIQSDDITLTILKHK